MFSLSFMRDKSIKESESVKYVCVQYLCFSLYSKRTNSLEVKLRLVDDMFWSVFAIRAHFMNQNITHTQHNTSGRGKGYFIG